MLQARTELWLERNKAAALHSLDEARANLDEAMRSADQVTRARIVGLKLQVDLLKANLAAKTDATGKQAATYLDESNAWYDSLKPQASQRWDKELTDMSTRIDGAKQAVERKDKQARAKLAELLERAAAMLKDEESAK